MTASWSNVLDDLLSPKPIAKPKSRFDTYDLSKKYPCAHINDLVPMEVIQPNMTFGPWIAGGAPLSWYQGEEIDHGDIDVFCRDVHQAQEVINRVKSYCGEKDDDGDAFTAILSSSIVMQTANATTMRMYHPDGGSKSWTIQIIHKRYFPTCQDVINNFDITVCQLGTDGTQFILNDQTAKHINSKTLYFNKPYQPDIVKRLVKYWSYGFEPHIDLISEIESLPNVTWKFNGEQEDYDNAFN